MMQSVLPSVSLSVCPTCWGHVVSPSDALISRRSCRDAAGLQYVITVSAFQAKYGDINFQCGERIHKSFYQIRAETYIRNITIGSLCVSIQNVAILIVATALIVPNADNSIVFARWRPHMPPSNTWFFWPTGGYDVFTGLTIVIDTHRHTDHAACNICRALARIQHCCLQCWRCRPKVQRALCGDQTRRDIIK